MWSWGATPSSGRGSETSGYRERERDPVSRTLGSRNWQKSSSGREMGPRGQRGSRGSSSLRRRWSVKPVAQGTVCTGPGRAGSGPSTWALAGSGLPTAGLLGPMARGEPCLCQLSHGAGPPSPGSPRLVTGCSEMLLQMLPEGVCPPCSPASGPFRGRAPSRSPESRGRARVRTQGPLYLLIPLPVVPAGNGREAMWEGSLC